MSKALLLNAAASGAAGSDPAYVDDVFSTYLYTGTGSSTPATSTSSALGSGFTHNIQFSSDGFYVTTHLPNSAVYIWSLSIPYDVSTITTSTNFSFTSQSTDSQGSRLSEDGTNAYVSHSGSPNSIFQYDLSTAYNASSASYASKSLDISGQVTNARGFFFKPDGTSLFIVCANNDAIYQYTLSTAWDLSTGSYASKSVSTGGETNPYNVFFNSAGTVMIVCGSANGLTEFALSTAWDVSTASATGTTGNPDTYGTTTLSFAADFADNGARLVIIDSAQKIGVGWLIAAYDIDSIGDGQIIQNGIDLSGEGGLVWVRQRDTTRNHFLVDTERGVNQTLNTDRDNSPQNTANSITAFNSNGFSLGSEAGVNENSGGYASWTFRKQPGFFDVVTYTGNGSARTISHNLGSVPGMILVKCTAGAFSWAVWHRSINTNSTQYLSLSTNAAVATDAGYWNTSDPTASVFPLGTNSNVNRNGRTYIAYLFAHDAQDFGTNSDEAIIKCGTYTGDTGPGGISIDLGFEPQWVMIKDLRSGYDWYMFDTMRGWSTENAEGLKSNSTAAESNSSGNIAKIRPLANGFQVPSGNGTGLNGSSLPFIYMAIRRPHKPASEFAATKLFDVGGYTGTAGTLDPAIQFPFDTDMFMLKRTNATGDMNVITRLIEYPSTGNNDTPKALVTSSTAAEADTYTFRSDDAKDIAIAQDSGDNLNVSGGTYSYYGFRRAPGFFDVVAYTGNGSNRTVSHNLGVKPELIIFKNRERSIGTNWTVYSSDLAVTKFMFLNTTAAASANGDSVYYFNNTEPTESVFSVGTGGYTNENNEGIIAYLFATVPGISKVGTYTGSGSTQTIDCGFSNGARFVLIKCTSGSANWYLWDSERGITSGLDNYIIVNQTAAQTTNSPVDVNPASSGFEVFGNDSDSNRNNETFLFLAIA